ncbi:MAG: HAMP domain-containing sensor histidine kinase [Clostridium sp.]|uniref:sensor histidine kinase n=1 Tax=Clostridium TaxID=1485 RepID=UPI0023313C4F|nr:MULTISPECIES: HAMP domain-containing sensor histidine kinase [Clostridium]MDB2118747.1 HAMP domain-containing sensor histidine kinase [Clostridium paraputrificum]MDU2755268.1 HAMP domain-containing sensor histidine kinase [Clostridium sp.]MDU2900934.1 HAMP domain-containing sensor histidine kinase [Clostridium sp.]MDU4426218.1 HAMP domain-containing sensor histidine kinase [Clostridium sp.]MDU7460269.1 HAMP domain-containing sensor histidine kinase [Clostridium sp.]
MLENEKWKDIIYWPIKNVVNYLLIMIFIYSFFYIVFIDYKDILDMINSILLIITGVSAIIIINTTMLLPEKIVRLISLLYVVIVIFALLELLPENRVYLQGIPFGQTGFERFMYMCFFIAFILIYTNIGKRENKKITMLSYFIIAIFICNQLTVRSFIIIKFIAVILFIISYFILADFKFIDNCKLNIAKSGNISFLLITISSFKSTYIYVYEIFVIIMIMYTLVLMNNIVNIPYNILFKDLFEKGIEMGNLNTKIVQKNKELEFSQNIVMKKEKIFKSFFQNVPIPLIILNKETLRIAFANSSFINVENKSLKSIINKKITSVIDIDEGKFNNLNYSEGKRILRGSISNEGDLKYFDIELIDSSTSSDEIILILNDVTSKVKVDSMKEAIQNKMLEENLKRDFLSNISHDLKTPINVIYSATQLEECLLKNNNIDGLKKYNTISKQNCISLIRLANNLIDTSRIESDYISANLKVKNIVEIIENIIATLVDYAHNNNVDLIFDTNEEEVYVELDEDFMQRIIVNLISNSIKFCNYNGMIKINVQASYKKVVVSVQDNGIGMEEEFIKDIFNRYSMGKNNEAKSNKGTGIGMFVVKRLMEIQNGNIFVNSKIGEGTRFDLVFNRVSERC